MIYFDNAATTAVSEKAAKEALRVMTEVYGNPSSVHDFGYEAEKLLRTSRKNMLDVLGSASRNDDFIFTSCGTEANNIALFGSLKNKLHAGKTVFFSDSEHPSVYNVSRDLSSKGYNVLYIPTKGGKLDLSFCEKNFSKDTVLISCMCANNETGALFDIAAINEIRKRLCPSAILHSDCVQAFCKTDFPLTKTGADLITVSGHKIHAPKGVGGLYIKGGIKVSGIMFGGGQEKDIRPGTEALPNISAMCTAALETGNVQNIRKVYDLRKYLVESINQKLPQVTVNMPEKALPHVVSLTLPNIKSEVMLRYLSSKGIYISAGSACSSKHRENRVLAAFGLSEKSADFTVRVSFSELNEKEEIDIFLSELANGISQLITVK